MKVKYTYYKHKTSGQLIMKQHFIDSLFGCPDRYCNKNKKKIEISDITEFIRITPSRFKKEVSTQRNFYKKKFGLS